MKLIRIGNDIQIEWTITRAGQPENFDNKEISVVLYDKYNKRQIFDYTIEDNVICGTFYGMNQTMTGVYSLFLTENEGQDDMVSLDYIDCFCLTSKLKNQTSNAKDPSNINTEILQITSNINTGRTLYTVQADWDEDDPAEPDYIKNKPTIPTKTSDLTNDSGFITSSILAAVATSGDYNDLTNKPTIPVVPTNVSAFNNDAKYIISNINDFDIEVVNQLPAEYDNVQIVLNNNTLYVVYSHDYEKDYLTLRARETGNIVLKIASHRSTSVITSISYSTDDGNNWTTVNNVDEQEVTATIPVNAGDKVLLKGEANIWGDAYLLEDTEIKFDVEGNVLSLFAGDNFYHYDDFENKQTLIRGLFINSQVVNAKNLSLPVNLIGLASHEELFKDCTNLVTPPELIATTLAERCYREMFSGCISLTTAPTLPATTLGEYCYQEMFRGCTSLVNVPSTLPATTLARYCYRGMFYGCTSLTTAPVLPATTLTDYCYVEMFRECSNLNNITMLATNIATDCFADWVTEVSATGTFTKDANTTIPTGHNGIPSGWTVINQ